MPPLAPAPLNCLPALFLAPFGSELSFLARFASDQKTGFSRPARKTTKLGPRLKGKREGAFLGPGSGSGSAPSLGPYAAGSNQGLILRRKAAKAGRYKAHSRSSSTRLARSHASLRRFRNHRPASAARTQRIDRGRLCNAVLAGSCRLRLQLHCGHPPTDCTFTALRCLYF